MGNRRNAPQRRPPSLGSASLVLSGVSGALFAFLALAQGVLSRLAPSGVDAPGVGLVVGALVLSLVLAMLTSLVLAAIALALPGRG